MATGAAIVGAGAAVAGVIQSNKNADDAIDAQRDQNFQNQEFITRQAEKARADIIPRFEIGQQALQQGTQGALDVLGQTIPQQLQSFQGGNVAAQQALLAGLPQIQNAILGKPTDLSGLQPFQPQLNTGFAQQTLPTPPNLLDVMSPLQQQETLQNSPDFQHFARQQPGFAEHLAGLPQFQEQFRSNNAPIPQPSSVPFDPSALGGMMTRQGGSNQLTQEQGDAEIARILHFNPGLANASKEVREAELAERFFN